MIKKRIIARLDVKNNALVKGIHLEGLRVLGDPSAFAEYYYKAGIDELVYIDVVASLYGRNGLVNLVRQTAKKSFVPLTVGGGVRTLKDVEELLLAGADKISINSAAVNNPQLIDDIASKYGASTLAVTIETILTDGQYKVFTDNGREYTGKLASEWAAEVADRGAGEVLITSVDNEGTGKGFCLDLIDAISEKISIPIVVHGGAGKAQHVKEALNHDAVSAVCIASLLHYYSVKQMSSDINHVQGNQAFLKSNGDKKNIESVSVSQLKQFLKDEGVNVR